MKRSTAMLVGAATAALAVSSVATTPAMAEPIPAASSYADLFEPVPNAMARLAADDASQPAARLQLAQYQGDNNGGGYDQQHHHHHAQGDYSGGGYNQHHHHHQAQGDYNGGYNRGYNQHHHHHHYRNRNRNRAWYRSNGYSWYGGRWVIRPVHHHHHHHHHDGY
jgi:hypothetical protein